MPFGNSICQAYLLLALLTYLCAVVENVCRYWDPTTTCSIWDVWTTPPWSTYTAAAEALSFFTTTIISQTEFLSCSKFLRVIVISSASKIGHSILSDSQASQNTFLSFSHLSKNLSDTPDFILADCSLRIFLWVDELFRWKVGTAVLFAQLLSLMFPQKCVTYIQVCWVRLIFISPPDVEQKGGRIQV